MWRFDDIDGITWKCNAARLQNVMLVLVFLSVKKLWHFAESLISYWVDFPTWSYILCPEFTPNSSLDQGCFGTLQTFACRRMVSPFPKPFGHSIVSLSRYPHRDIDPVPSDQDCALPLQVGSASYLLLLSSGTCPLRVFPIDSGISQYVTRRRSLTISWHKSCRLRLESECTSP